MGICADAFGGLLPHQSEDGSPVPCWQEIIRAPLNWALDLAMRKKSNTSASWLLALWQGLQIWHYWANVYFKKNNRVRWLKSLGRENSDNIQVILCQYRFSKGLNRCTLGYFVVSEDQKVMLMFCKVITVQPKPTKREAGTLHLVRFPKPNRHVDVKLWVNWSNKLHTYMVCCNEPSIAHLCGLHKWTITLQLDSTAQPGTFW